MDILLLQIHLYTYTDSLKMPAFVYTISSFLIKHSLDALTFNDYFHDFIIVLIHLWNYKYRYWYLTGHDSFYLKYNFYMYSKVL